jgi:hypothetical protein
MLCTGCGKRVPFVGDVCPYCQRDKTRSQVFHLIGYSCGIASGLIGYLFWQWPGAIGLFAAGVIAANVVLSCRGSAPPEHTRK